MRVSTPEATAVNLVRFAKVAGQLDNVATVIAELAAKIDPMKLVTAAKVIGDVPNAQRLGYILDQVRARRLAGPLKSWVDAQSPKPVQLRSNQRGKEGQEDRRWHVLVDQLLDIEA